MKTTSTNIFPKALQYQNVTFLNKIYPIQTHLKSGKKPNKPSFLPQRKKKKERESPDKNFNPIFWHVDGRPFLDWGDIIVLGLVPSPKCPCRRSMSPPTYKPLGLVWFTFSSENLL
jgi:hypothetical protein